MTSPAARVRVHEIPPSEFGHGRTRNLGATSPGDVLVFTSQDAYAADETWLARLVERCARGDSTPRACTGGSSHTTTPPRRSATSSTSSTARIPASSAWRQRRAELRADALLERELRNSTQRLGGVPVRRRLDHERGSGVVAARPSGGYELVYEPRAAVHHSHTTRWPAPFAGSSTRASRPSARTLAGRNGSGSAAPAARYARGEVTWLWETGQRRWIPYAAGTSSRSSPGCNWVAATDGSLLSGAASAHCRPTGTGEPREARGAAASTSRSARHPSPGPGNT